MGRPTLADTPGEAATLLEVFGVGFIVGIGFPLDFDVALNLGAGHPIEVEHFAFSVGQPDGDAKVPTVSVFGEVPLFSPGRRFVGVSSFSPAPELIPDAVVQLVKGPLGCSISVVVGPTPQKRVEFTNERFLAEAQSGFNTEPDFVPQGLDVTLCGIGQEFIPKFAHGVPQEVEALVDRGDDGLLL